MAAAALLAAHRAHAQAAYPNRPIRFHVGFPPGGVADTAARVIGPALSARLGQPIVLDHRAGAGGAIGVDAVAKAAPDGYTMGFGVSGALTSSVVLSSKLPYDPTRDIAPVSVVVSNPILLVVNAASGIGNLREFVAAAKASPTPFSYGTPGPGTAMHLAGALLAQQAGIELTHIGYKGSAPAALDLMGGQISSAIIDLSTAKPHLQSGRLRAMGVTTAARTALAPDVPTLAEAGAPGYAFNSWFGVVLPAGTPPDVLTRVHAELSAVLRDPAVTRPLLDAGIDPVIGTPQDMAAQIRREIDVAAQLVRSGRVKVE